jgi:hypothetical protein
MSDSGQGGGERSWWEKPDQEPAAQDPYRTTSGDASGEDAHDPYGAVPGTGGSTRAQPPGAPTESLPRYGQPPHGQQGQQQYGQPPQGQPQYGQPQSPYAPPPASWPAPQNQQYPDQYGGYGSPQPPVTGMAHAVLWTAVGGVVLLFSGVGWIAAIVALALTPGARREILESGGAKRGLGFLLAGKICAWVTIGLTVLAVIGLAIVIGLGSSGAFDDTSSFDGNGLNTLFVP